MLSSNCFPYLILWSGGPEEFIDVIAAFLKVHFELLIRCLVVFILLQFVRLILFPLECYFGYIFEFL